MILNDRQICALATDEGMIVPFVREQTRRLGDAPCLSFGVSSFGYDVRAARTFKIFTDVHGVTIDPKRFDERSFVDVCAPDGVDHVVLPPRSFALTSSVERFSMPKDVVGVCLGKSTYARCGIIVNVTPLEPGWRGFVTIEISNTAPLPAKIYVDEGIMQVLFFIGEAPGVDYADRAGKYQDQLGIVSARV